MADTTRYGIFFSYRNTTVRLPVNPSEYSISYPGDNNQYKVLDIGDVIIPIQPGLRTISWEGLLPGDPDRPYVLTSGSFKEPGYYIDLFRGYMEEGSLPRLIINRFDDNGRNIYDTNIQVVITDFQTTEKGGETTDFYYTITCTEYRPFDAEQVSITPSGTGMATAATTPQRPVDSGVISVGDTVIANGTYYNDSYGSPPTGKATNLRTTVTRIVGSPKSGQIYPYHIGTATGWLAKSQLKKV